MNCRLDFLRPVRLAAAVLLLLPAVSAAALDDVGDEDEAPAPAPAPAPAEPALPAPAPEPEPAPVELPPADAPAPTPAEGRPISGFWKGRHRLELVAGYHFGNTVRDAGILAAPVTGQPGSRDYPAVTPLQVELEDSPVFGLRYAYFAGDAWGFTVSLEGLSSEIVDPDVDLASDAARISISNIGQDANLSQILLERLAAHQAKHDMSVTFVDVGAMHVFNPLKRFPVEIGGGIGWAFSSLDGPVAYERLVTSDRLIGQSDPTIVANEVFDPPPPHGHCLADNDPCIELEEQGGLTWHAYIAMGYAFTPAVQLRMGWKARFVEQLVDPGDSNIMSEATLGLSFQFGGQ